MRQRKAVAVLPILEGLQASGVVSLNALAKRLNELRYETPRGGAWPATAVKRAMARVAQ